MRGVTAVLAVVMLAGCGQSATGTTTSPPSTSTGPPSRSTGSGAVATHVRARPRHRAGAGRLTPSGLAYSAASAQIVQAQPAAGSCHALGTGPFSRPDPRCTPGALNPAVTQATIGQTICASGWTSTVRPPESITEPEKRASMAAYADGGSLQGYEYDHFVPLELGGAVNDPRNLWPEPGPSPNPKDTVEDGLNRQVCDGQMTLAAAQRAIAGNWIALAASRPPPRSASAPAAASAQCSIIAAYSSTYHDYDVYVHSNQPDQAVTVTDSAGHTDSWHTNAGGSADVYFHPTGDAAGETVTARVGGASCSTTL